MARAELAMAWAAEVSALAAMSVSPCSIARMAQSRASWPVVIISMMVRARPARISSSAVAGAAISVIGFTSLFAWGFGVSGPFRSGVFCRGAVPGLGVAPLLGGLHFADGLVLVPLPDPCQGGDV